MFRRRATSPTSSPTTRSTGSRRATGRGPSSSTCRTRASTTTTSPPRARRTSSRPSATAESSRAAPSSRRRARATRRSSRRSARAGCANQRNSWHGVDFPYHATLDVGDFFKRYAETLMGVDDSVGRVLDYLEKERLLDSTLVHLHGRQRLRLRRARPDRQAHRLRGVDARADGHAVPRALPGRPHGGGSRREPRRRPDDPRRPPASSLPRPWWGRACFRWPRASASRGATELLYEYYWERNYPQTPTVFALRGGPLQVHPLPRALGRGRAVRPAGRPAGDDEPRLCPRPGAARESDERTPVRPARGDERHDDPALSGPRAGDRPARPGAERAAPFPPVFVSKPRSER